MQDNVETRGDMQVGALERTGQGEDKRDVVILGGWYASDDGSRGRKGVCRDATGERGVVVDVKF